MEPKSKIIRLYNYLITNQYGHMVKLTNLQVNSPLVTQGCELYASGTIEWRYFYYFYSFIILLFYHFIFIILFSLYVNGTTKSLDGTRTGTKLGPTKEW